MVAIERTVKRPRQVSWRRHFGCLATTCAPRTASPVRHGLTLLPRLRGRGCIAFSHHSFTVIGYSWHGMPSAGKLEQAIVRGVPARMRNQIFAVGWKPRRGRGAGRRLRVLLGHVLSWSVGFGLPAVESWRGGRRPPRLRAPIRPLPLADKVFFLVYCGLALAHVKKPRGMSGQIERW